MAEDGEDWNGLEMTIWKSLPKFFKMHERWRSSFNEDRESDLLYYLNLELLQHISDVINRQSPFKRLLLGKVNLVVQLV